MKKKRMSTPDFRYSNVGTGPSDDGHRLFYLQQESGRHSIDFSPPTPHPPDKTGGEGGGGGGRQDTDDKGDRSQGRTLTSQSGVSPICIVARIYTETDISHLAQFPPVITIKDCVVPLRTVRV